MFLLKTDTNLTSIIFNISYVTIKVYNRRHQIIYLTATHITTNTELSRIFVLNQYIECFSCF